MTGLIDIGIGNVGSLRSMLKKIGEPSVVIQKPADLAEVARVIFPGVGSFDHGITQLNTSGLRDEIEVLVLEKSMPFLGVCLGMQLLGHSSEEGRLAGLGWLNAQCHRFTVDQEPHKLRIPHMGWNDVEFTSGSIFATGDNSLPRFYFVHSYKMHADCASNVEGKTWYGSDFVSVVRSKNIVGCQFHPEKSHHFGMSFLRKFIAI